MVYRNKGKNIANGIIAGIILICGIAQCAISGVLLQGVKKAHFAFLFPLWSPGVAFILSGIVGIIAAVVRRQGVYILELVLCILTLILVGVAGGLSYSFLIIYVHLGLPVVFSLGLVMIIVLLVLASVLTCCNTPNNDLHTSNSQFNPKEDVVTMSYPRY